MPCSQPSMILYAIQDVIPVRFPKKKLPAIYHNGLVNSNARSILVKDAMFTTGNTSCGQWSYMPSRMQIPVRFHAQSGQGISRVSSNKHLYYITQSGRQLTKDKQCWLRISLSVHWSIISCAMFRMQYLFDFTFKVDKGYPKLPPKKSHVLHNMV